MNTYRFNDLDSRGQAYALKYYSTHEDVIEALHVDRRYGGRVEQVLQDLEWYFTTNGERIVF